jgi:hypothetical protein
MARPGVIAGRSGGTEKTVEYNPLDAFSLFTPYEEGSVMCT